MTPVNRLCYVHRKFPLAVFSDSFYRENLGIQKIGVCVASLLYKNTSGFVKLRLQEKGRERLQRIWVRPAIIYGKRNLAR
jgi:hypothetical protein